MMKSKSLTWPKTPRAKAAKRLAARRMLMKLAKAKRRMPLVRMPLTPLDRLRIKTPVPQKVRQMLARCRLIRTCRA